MYLHYNNNIIDIYYIILNYKLTISLDNTLIGTQYS